MRKEKRLTACVTLLKVNGVEGFKDTIGGLLPGKPEISKEELEQYTDISTGGDQEKMQSLSRKRYFKYLFRLAAWLILKRGNHEQILEGVPLCVEHDEK